MSECEKFAAGERYEDRNDQYNRDRRLVQIRGVELQDNIRHVVAKATERPRSVEPRPIDQAGDPDTAETVTALLERDLSDPWKGWEDKFEAALISARQMRLGVVMMDWVPDFGMLGEIFYRWVDPRRIMWDPCYEDPHDPLCPWLLEIKRVDVEQARKLYKAPWIMADKDAITSSGEYRAGVPLIRSGTGERLPKPGSVKDNKATLWCCWYKHDPDYDGKPIDEPLGAGERYMACGSGCGYRSETQDELTASGELEQYDDPATPEVELPEMIQGGMDEAGNQMGCPTCGGNLERIDKQAGEPGKQKKRLVILAPFSPSPDDKPAYDGKWPIPKARSFPGFFITANNEPGECTPHCDTDDYWDSQLASDQLRTLAVQRVFEHRNYWIMPENGINDYQRNRFMFRDDQFNVMFRDNTQSEFGALNVEHVDGTGLDPSFMLAFQITHDSLTRNMPKADFGPADTSTRDVAVGTVQQMVQQAETQTAHFKRRIARALSKFYGVAADYQLATLTPERAARVNTDGLDLLLTLHGDDLPQYDFAVEETPEFTGLEKSKAEAFESLFAVVERAVTMGLDPIEAVDLFAELNNLPRSVVRRWQKMWANAQMKQEQAAQEAAMGGGLPPEMGMEESINGGGMEPLPLQ